MSIQQERSKDSESGVALIAAVLVVALLLAIGISFAFNMRLEEKAAVNYMNSVKANYIAQAGIDRAITALRDHARNHAYFCLSVFPPDFSGSIGNDTYTVTVIDTASQIYLNKDAGMGPGGTNLDEMLEALDGIDSALADSIINYRNTLPDNIFITKEQVKGTTDIGQITYNKFRDDIAVNAWVNPATGRAPVNVNTASREVLIAVLEPLADVTQAEAEAVADHIIGSRPIRTWAEFNARIGAVVTAGCISAGDAVTIKNNANPNIPEADKPAGATTEFSFNSGGYFEIKSTGRVYDLAGDFAAERKIRAVVDIFDIWHQTTEVDFTANTLRAVDAVTRFSSPGTAQLAHFLVETEEMDMALCPHCVDDPHCPHCYPHFNFSATGTWESRATGGFDANLFNPLTTAAYLYRNDTQHHTATCQWNFAITDDLGLSGGYYEVFAWWLESPTNSPSVDYSGAGGATGFSATANQQLDGGDTWYRLGSLPLIPAGTTDFSSIGIKALTTAGTGTVYSIADAMLLAAVDDVPGGFAGTMTATLDIGEDVRLGTIAWTEAFVDDIDTEITFAVGIGPFPGTANYYDPAGHPLLNPNTGTTISYRAYFSRTAGLTPPADPPILDDVTITYLPRTRILYWREVTE